MSADARYRPLRHLSRWLWLGRLGIAVIVVGSLIPMPDVPSPIEHGDKLEHLLGYFGITAWYAQLVPDRGRLALYALAFLALGMAIELLQGLTSWRSADWNDLVADAIGVAAGWLLALTPLRHVLARFEQRLASARSRSPD